MKESRETVEEWLDFKAIKETADPHKVLSHYHLLEHLEERGAELVGWCPFGSEHGKDDSFSVNVEKRVFKCFACKARGSLLDLVAKLENATLREAAQTLGLIMGEGRAHGKSSGRPYGKERGNVGEASGVASETVGEALPEAPSGTSETDDDSPAIMDMNLASRLSPHSR